MKISFTILLAFLMTHSGFGQAFDNKQKNAAVHSIDSHTARMIEISDQIWEHAELAFEEAESSRLLADYAAENGFTVERGVADIATAFVATYGKGSPVIGILGEYDALPGISQKKQASREYRVPGGGGHGCGHNLFGTASLGAAIAIKEQIESGELKGTIKFFGTPAEEKYFGKLWMARAGLFDNLDVCMDWHPGARTVSGVQSSLALIDFIVEFRGQAAHASSDPWNGRSATDAMELYAHGINAFREHIKPTVRIHYHMQQAGDVVNVVPDYARIWTRVRDTRRDGMMEVYNHVRDIAQGAALMTKTEYEISLVSGVHEILVNRTGGTALQKNLEALGDIQYTEEEIRYAKEIQKATGKEQSGLDGSIQPLEETLEHPSGGSTDVGDVSWIVPVVRMSATIAPTGTPWHSWAVVACGGMSIGHKGMITAAKALSTTMVDLYLNPALVEDIKREFKERKADAVYSPILPAGPPPTNYEGIK